MAGAAVKTERITILGTPEFKHYLTEEAGRYGVSVSELVRQRCMNPGNVDEEEALLLKLVVEATAATERADKSLTKGLAAAEKTLKALNKIGKG